MIREGRFRGEAEIQFVPGETAVIDPWTADEFKPFTLEEIEERLSNYRAKCEKHKVKFDEFEAMAVMRVDPHWYADEAVIDLIERYMFFRQNPSLAFSVPFDEQPHIWVVAKILLDPILGMSAWQA